MVFHAPAYRRREMARAPLKLTHDFMRLHAAHRCRIVEYRYRGARRKMMEAAFRGCDRVSPAIARTGQPPIRMLCLARTLSEELSGRRFESLGSDAQLKVATTIACTRRRRVGLQWKLHAHHLQRPDENDEMLESLAGSCRSCFRAPWHASATSRRKLC
jgi:hypothetical protein